MDIYENLIVQSFLHNRIKIILELKDACVLQKEEYISNLLLIPKEIKHYADALGSTILKDYDIKVNETSILLFLNNTIFLRMLTESEDIYKISFRSGADIIKGAVIISELCKTGLQGYPKDVLKKVGLTEDIKGYKKIKKQYKETSPSEMLVEMESA